MDEQALRKMSTEILTDIKEWRRAHPRATYVQIEDEVHKRMMQLEAQIIEGAVQESPSREWGRGSKVEAALCPKCAVPLQARGKHKRTLPGNLAPRQQEHLAHLACFMPFDKVAQMMEELLSVQTYEETVRRLSERAGSWMEAAQRGDAQGDGSG